MKEERIDKMLYNIYKKLGKHRIENSEMTQYEKRIHLKTLDVECALKTLFMVTLINS